MTMIPVNSSNLSAVGYDNRTQTLRVSFLNRTVYDYYNVPENLYQGLMTASSHGGYLDRYIKKANYRYAKVS
ncbi:MAG: KTSC domain-containing protein [Bacillus cereus]|nr:KTSC domain-containing protein [Bacillus cereus]MDR2994577.1 KTSC domain-containing protein [Bacillus cereus]